MPEHVPDRCYRFDLKIRYYFKLFKYEYLNFQYKRNIYTYFEYIYVSYI